MKFLEHGDILFANEDYAIIERYYISNITHSSIIAPFSSYPYNNKKLECGIGCYVCGRISWNPNDVNNHYCGYCHATP